MNHFVRNERNASDGFIHVYNGLNKQELANKIDDILSASGYKIKQGQPGNATYEKGNRIMRLLLGAFYKYFKFNLLVSDASPTEVAAELVKKTSGMSGGLIGVSQVKKELNRLASEFQTI